MMLKWCRRLHNWLGLLLVIQLLFWFTSGLVMSIMPIEQVRGEHLKAIPSVTWQSAVVSPASVFKQHSPTASMNWSQQISWQNDQLQAIPVYVITESTSLFRYSALTGELLAPLTEGEIRRSAEAQYLGTGHLLDVQFLQVLPQEVHNLTPPLWQVTFADDDSTTFYLDPMTGMVARVRTFGWRVFDFFWMLHIMDYQDRSNFNNPLLISTAAASVLFTLTGIFMLWQRYRPRRLVR